MLTVEEQDPRAGLGDDLVDFRDWMREKGYETDRQLRIVAEGITDVATMYRWMRGEATCRSRLHAKAVRERMNSLKKNLA